MLETCTTSTLTQNKIAVKFALIGMHEVFPHLSKFFFMSIHPCDDIYSISRFEPMRGLLLGFDRLLKKCTVLTLGDENRATSSI